MKKTNKDILNKLKETGFKIPEDYFENFEKVFQKVNKKNSTGFKIPKNYFENYEDNFYKEDKLTTVKNTGFKTPDQYFENLETYIYPKTKTSKVISLKRQAFVKIVGLSIAASLLLFFGISNFNTNKVTTNAIAATEIDAWLEEGLVTFNTYEIEDMFTENDLNLIAEETDEISDYLKYTDIETLLLEN